MRRFRGRRVLVLADLVADEFVYGRVERISREAPVLILRHDATDVRLGGGANAVHNIRTLGARPLPFGVLGDDAHGRRLRALLREKRIPTTGIVTATGYDDAGEDARPGRRRPLHQAAGRAHRPLRAASRRAARRAARSSARCARSAGRSTACWSATTASACSTPSLVRAAIAFARRRRVPVTVDSRFALLRFRGMTAVTPNEAEVEEALGVTIGHDRRRLEAAGRALLRRLGVPGGARHAGQRRHGALRARASKPLHIPIHGTDQVADVTGAGDTVIATFTLALAAGATPAEAARLANYAGGIVVMKRATATVSADELVRGRARRRSARGRSAGEAPRRARSARSTRCASAWPRRGAPGRRWRSPTAASTCSTWATSATCEGARAEADVLVVGVNGDASVRRLKGEGRPVMPAEDRALLVAALRGGRPRGRVRGGRRERGCCSRCGPTCTARAPTTRPRRCPERDVVRSYGGRVAIVGDPKDHDTRALLARIRG